jgi:hypothetical protein
MRRYSLCHLKRILTLVLPNSREPIPIVSDAHRFWQQMILPQLEKAIPRNRMALIISVIGSVVIVSVCGIIGLSMAATHGYASVPNGAATVTGTATNATPGSMPGIGDTIIKDNVAVTLLAAQFLADDPYLPSKVGYNYMLVRLQYTNNSRKAIAYSEFDFQVDDGSGTLAPGGFVPPYVYRSNELLNSGTLPPKGSVVGDIIFQVLQNNTKARLVWTPNSFYGLPNGQNVWLLGL